MVLAGGHIFQSWHRPGIIIAESLSWCPAEVQDATWSRQVAPGVKLESSGYVLSLTLELPVSVFVLGPYLAVLRCYS